jgi:suppressor for copper-sensitivity B
MNAPPFTAGLLAGNDLGAILRAMRHWLACLFLALSPGIAEAGCNAVPCAQQKSAELSTVWSGDANAPSRLILASASHGYGGPVWIAIEMDIADGWFVYATDQKDGAGPRLEWSGSVNLGPPALRWPTPGQMIENGKTIPVYRGHVVLPVSIAPIRADGDIMLGLTMSYAVCGEVCRPAHGVHRILLAAAPVPQTDAARSYARAIAAALEQAPHE